MSKLPPMTQVEIVELAEASEDAVHEWRRYAERTRKSIGGIEPTLDHTLAIQRHALAMLDMADVLMSRIQMRELRVETERQIRERIAAERK